MPTSHHTTAFCPVVLYISTSAEEKENELNYSLSFFVQLVIYF